MPRSKIHTIPATDKTNDRKKDPSKRSSLTPTTTKSPAPFTAITAAAENNYHINNNNNNCRIARKPSSPDSIDIQIVSEILRDHDISSSDLSKKLSNTSFYHTKKKGKDRKLPLKKRVYF